MNAVGYRQQFVKYMVERQPESGEEEKKKKKLWDDVVGRKTV